MKSIVFVVGLAVLAAIFLVTGFTVDPLFAVSGCCKERNSYQARWAKNGKNFAACKRLNKKDGDDVFDESGLYWWDQKCQ